MKIRQWAVKLLLAVFLFMITSLASADIYWESVMETKGTPQGMSVNLPKEILANMNKTEVVKYYFSEYGTRTDTSDAVMIMNFKNMNLYHLNPRNKTYRKIDINAMSKEKRMQNMMKKLDESIKIVPVDETRKIAGYDCKKYNVTTMIAQAEYWISRDVKDYQDVKKIMEKLKKFIKNSSMLPHLSMEGFLIEKMDGFPVQTQVNKMGMITTTTLKNIEKKVLDKKLFTIPKEYKIRKGSKTR